VTEFGFDTNANDDWSVSERDQATLTWREYNKLLTMPDVEAALVHTLRDDKPQGFFESGGYGWVRNDGNLKPVYCDFSARAGSPAC
jgi:hypothetical protein